MNDLSRRELEAEIEMLQDEVKDLSQENARLREGIKSRIDRWYQLARKHSAYANPRLAGTIEGAADNLQDMLDNALDGEVES